MNDLRSLFERLPIGWSVVVHDGRRYGVTRTVHGDGRSQSIYAEALDGSDVVSANLYDLGDEGLLRPCEMPQEKVLDFLHGLEPEAS
ncbi:MAG: peptide methionine sulfoxide reductase [Marmoricola sp.]